MAMWFPQINTCASSPARTDPRRSPGRSPLTHGFDTDPNSRATGQAVRVLGIFFMGILSAVGGKMFVVTPFPNTVYAST